MWVHVQAKLLTHETKYIESVGSCARQYQTYLWCQIHPVWRKRLGALLYYHSSPSDYSDQWSVEGGKIGQVQAECLYHSRF